MRSTSSCPQYLLPSPPTIPPYRPMTNLKTMRTHHNQYLHPHHLHHTHHRLQLQSTLLLPLLTLGHLHLIHLAHHQHHHISITNLQLHHPAQFGVISTYTTHHIAPIHHHAPHQFHLVLHLLHLHSLLWCSHHLYLRTACLTCSTLLNLVHRTHHADPLHLSTSVMLILQHLLFLRTFLLILIQNHLLSSLFLRLLHRQHRLLRPYQPGRSRGCSAGLSAAWPE